MGQIQLLETVFPVVIEEPVSWGQEKTLHKADHYKALVDHHTGNVFSIVTTDYKVIRHEEAIAFLDIELAKVSDLGRYEAKTYLHNNGARMLRQYIFPERTVEIAKRDVIHPTINLYNSYDQSWSLTILLGAFRLVCKNGLVTGEKFFQMKRKHTRPIEEINIRKDLSSALRRFNVQAQVWKRWHQNPLSEKSYVKVMEMMNLSKRATSIVLERLHNESTGYDRDGFPIITIWNFFNILTWYITYQVVSLNQRVEMESRLRKAMIYFRYR
jgi:hypothetical protein